MKRADPAGCHQVTAKVHMRNIEISTAPFQVLLHPGRHDEAQIGPAASGVPHRQQVRRHTPKGTRRSTRADPAGEQGDVVAHLAQDLGLSERHFRHAACAPGVSHGSNQLEDLHGRAPATDPALTAEATVQPAGTTASAPTSTPRSTTARAATQAPSSMTIGALS